MYIIGIETMINSSIIYSYYNFVNPKIIPQKTIKKVFHYSKTKIIINKANNYFIKIYTSFYSVS